MLEQECLLRSPLLLCFFISFLLHPVVTAVIPLGSKLSVVDNNCWVSSNGDFAFGFFNISNEPNQFSAGIRFNSKSMLYSQQTVVWVAGAHVTVGNRSYFQLTPEGELVLFDSLQGVTLWTSATGNRAVVSAALHDDGNLVLIDREKNIIWQSFDTPSDTLLPGQSLSVYQILRAATKNPVSSYYSLYMNASGHLQLRWESNIIYWTSESPSSASNLTAFLTTDGALQLRDLSLKAVWSVFGEDHNDSVKYRFLRLDADGNLRLYSWVETSQSWRSVWQAVENQCKVFATCGQRGMCVFTASGSADCVCPFEVTENKECLVPYEHECESGSSMLSYKNTYLYGIYPPDDSVIMSSLQQCEQLCLNDSQCTVATFTNNGSPQCSIKKTKYVTGYADPSLSSVSFVKRCSGPFAVNPSLTNSPPPKLIPRLCVPCIMGAASGTFFILAIFQLGIVFCICRRKNSTMRQVTLAFTCPNSKGILVLSFSEIKSLTGDLKDPIGPNMFKGVLPNDRSIAVKDLKASIEERKFRSAVLKIGSIHHKNLVKLEGYCCEFNHRFLVYEYAKNGSLDKYIDDCTLCKRLTWRKRVEICSSVAKAICYLHSGCREFVSHGNLKCENVMLDENLVAKVSEYGFAIVNGEATYCGFSAEKDVGDFGKLVLTLLSGCRDQEQLCEWAYKERMEGSAANVVDKRIDGGVDSEELECALRIAFWCLQMDERRRPSMEEVVRVLDGTLNVDPPPPPFALQMPLQEDDPQEHGSESVLQ
ncbi:G-type lectin S-receptor-like serine/threonine-protein kinase SD3-1 [Gastrolobium bilobum]|uniref:G-type lectin S-receptor-like serine/threonine-protein kinase SD3-1 n=1 Tax=Gastrolobium bilobum TaxID=150636 RepID=UPI002AB18BA4|nr:G-type lectin S-receptor-like serine/threonine-protein kinase SD3-1 [Gastrolobium bilobum]